MGTKQYNDVLVVYPVYHGSRTGIHHPRYGYSHLGYSATSDQLVWFHRTYHVMRTEMHTDTAVMPTFMSSVGVSCE